MQNASGPVSAQYQAVTLEAQSRVISISASAPAPVSTGLSAAQLLYNQSCLTGSGTATQISGNAPAGLISR